MPNNYTQFVILCEDIKHASFIRHLLIKRGVERRRIRESICSPGKLSGEKYVRTQYPIEVAEHRRRPHIRVGLIVCIDADTNSISRRHQQLNEALLEEGQVLRQPDERIGIFIPKRNIESWLHYFAPGSTTDEITDYKKLHEVDECPTAAGKLSQQCHEGLPDSALPSLKEACIELKRLF